jgi:hypothetical protein
VNSSARKRSDTAHAHELSNHQFKKQHGENRALISTSAEKEDNDRNDENGSEADVHKRSNGW